MSLLMFRTRGAVHQSVNGLPSVWHSTFRPLWYTPVEQPRPSSPLNPAPRSPLSPSFSHLLIPCLLSCFPTLAWMERSDPPHHHNSWIPPPAPTRYSTPNAPGIRGIVYVSGFSYCLAAVVITGMQKESLLQHLSHLWSDPKIWAQSLPNVCIRTGRRDRDLLLLRGLRDTHSSGAAPCLMLQGKFAQAACLRVVSKWWVTAPL